MFALQCVLLLVVWIGYGVIQWRRSGRLREKLIRIPRNTRVWVAILSLFAGACGLLFGLYMVQTSGGSDKDQLHWWAWGVIALLGLGFVHAQTVAASMMVTLVQEAVTTSDEGTSTKVEQDLTRE